MQWMHIVQYSVRNILVVSLVFNSGLEYREPNLLPTALTDLLCIREEWLKLAFLHTLLFKQSSNMYCFFFSRKSNISMLVVNVKF